MRFLGWHLHKNQPKAHLVISFLLCTVTTSVCFKISKVSQNFSDRELVVLGGNDDQAEILDLVEMINLETGKLINLETGKQDHDQFQDRETGM